MDDAQESAPTTPHSSHPRVLASAEYEAGRFLEPMRRELEPAGIELVFAEYTNGEELIAAAREPQLPHHRDRLDEDARAHLAFAGLPIDEHDRNLDDLEAGA